MANIKEAATWSSGVYQIEPNDNVIGGENGIANRQAKELANRTAYLKQEQDKLKTATAAASTTKSGTTMLSSSVTSSGETKAATEKAAKTAMDRANAAYNLANGKATGTHSHPMSQVTGLDTALGAKAPLASPALTGAPTAPTATAATNTDQIATTKFVKTAIAALVAGAPAQLDTLKEIATALGNKGNLEASLLAEIGKKATKTTTLAGYGISDFVIKTLTTEDLDTVKVPGLYKQDASENSTAARHYPENTAGSLTVKPSTWGWQQIYITYNTQRVYIRNSSKSDGSSWSAWVRVDAIDSVPSNRTLTAGNGLTGGGNLGSSRTFALGTPSKIGASSTNSVGAETHTHEIDSATTSRAGIVQLSTSITGTSTTRAATESAVKALNDSKANIVSPAFSGAPTAPTAAQTVNNAQIATTAFVKSAIAALVGGAPAQLDTLKEIAAALGNNASLSATLTAAIGKKADLTAVTTKDHLIGIPLPYPKAQVPSGFVAMQGQAFDKSRYPILAQRYPSGRLPDLRGEFIRGWDNGRNADPNRDLLTSQAGSLTTIDGGRNAVVGLSASLDKTHGDLSLYKDLQIDPITTTTPSYIYQVWDGSPRNFSSGELRHNLSASGDAFSSGHAVGATRPRNVSFQYICLAG
ncbi:hypothetical protein A1D23_13065 [Chelonobacter oris]|uniref:tail fiber protein n=1 Tax=Chelonobacter oris TaxID=505317 RepID=UPI00244BF993|nr:tail fiber protein [Chelonobacter oris]MDH3001468.1 hypothetical protein [Chelonobacter oris]